MMCSNRTYTARPDKAAGHEVSITALEKDLEYALTRVTELEAAMPQTNQSLNASAPRGEAAGGTAAGSSLPVQRSLGCPPVSPALLLKSRIILLSRASSILGAQCQCA